MVREKLDEFWITRLFSVFANEPELKDKAISDNMREIADGLDRTDYPATRTVNKYRDTYARLDAHIKAGYQDFRWPDSMEAGLLPWEASATTLELLGSLQKKDVFTQSMLRTNGPSWTVNDLPRGRPSIRLTHWYWRLTQAVPDLTEEPKALDQPTRYDIARAFAAHEAAGHIPEWLRVGVEGYLSMGPWRGPANSVDYKMAVEAGLVLELTKERLSLRDFPLDPYPLEAITELVGRGTAEHWGRVIRDHTSQQENRAIEEDANGEA